MISTGCSGHGRFVRESPSEELIPALLGNYLFITRKGNPGRICKTKRTWILEPSPEEQSYFKGVDKGD